MDQYLYRDILVFDFFPFMAGAYNDFDCYLHQDNDGKHASKLCKQVLSDYNIKWVSKFLFPIFLPNKLIPNI